MIGYKNLVLMIGGSLCAWMCGCDDDDDYIPVEPQNSIAVLIVDDASNNFQGGKIYNYQQNHATYNLQVENVPAADAGFIKVHYTEENHLLYYATQIFMGSGEIIVPDPLIPAQDFEHVLTNDFVLMPTTAVELTNAPSPVGTAQQKWASIQGLQIVRNALSSGNSKVHYFKQSLDGGFTDNAKWVFIIKLQ